VLTQRLEADFAKWAEIHGKDSVVTLDATELRRMTSPVAERLANEILGAGTFKQIQDVA
jgi:hypothetical protein